MKLSEVMVEGTVTCTADLPLNEVADLMKVNDVGAVVVVDEAQRPVGMITDRDIALSETSDRLSAGQVGMVQSVMNFDVKTISENCDLFEAIKVMTEASVRRLPVVNAAGSLVGLISLGDVLKVAVTLLSNLVNAVSPDFEKIQAAA